MDLSEGKVLNEVRRKRKQATKSQKYGNSESVFSLTQKLLGLMRKTPTLTIDASWAAIKLKVEKSFLNGLIDVLVGADLVKRLSRNKVRLTASSYTI